MLFRSPFLFLLVAEGFSGLMHNAVKKGGVTLSHFHKSCLIGVNVAPDLWKWRVLF